MSNQSTYQPTGSHGEHPTVIGNMLDPNVNADGAKSGLGVGGTSEKTVRDEGREHVKQHGYGDEQPGHGQGSVLGQEQGQNYGSSTGTSTGTGIGSREPGYDQQHTSGIDHIRQSAGLGSSTTGSGSGYQSGTGSNVASASDYQGTGTGSGVTGGHHHPTPGSYPEDRNSGGNVIASGVQSSHASGLADRPREGQGYGSQTGSTSGYDNQPSTTGTHGSHHGSHAGTAAGAGLGAAGAGAAAEDVASRHHHGSSSGRDNLATTSTSTDPSRNTAANAATPTDSNVRTGTDPTTSADPTTAKTAQGQTSTSSGTDTRDTSSGHGGTATKTHQPTEAEAINDSDGKGGPPPSIPTAGGERIGTKHWGESKIITDKNPPKEEFTETSGHSDDLTAKNTASNTGSADGAQKESFVDKIKDKLHVGHK